MFKNRTFSVMNSANWQAQTPPSAPYFSGSSMFTIILLSTFSSRKVLVTNAYPIIIHCKTLLGSTQITDTYRQELREYPYKLIAYVHSSLPELGPAQNPSLFPTLTALEEPL